MTSSIANNPYNSTPFAQHHSVRNPGFGETPFTRTNVNIMPALISYANVVIATKANELSNRLISGVTILNSPAVPTAEQFVLGIIRVDGGFTLPVNPTPIYTTSELITGFTNVFDKAPKNNDSFIVSLDNTTGAPVSIVGTTGVAVTLPSSSNNTLLVVFTNSNYALFKLR